MPQARKDSKGVLQCGGSGSDVCQIFGHVRLRFAQPRLVQDSDRLRNNNRMAREVHDALVKAGVSEEQRATILRELASPAPPPEPQRPSQHVHIHIHRNESA